MHFYFICQGDFSESLSYAAKQQVFYCYMNHFCISVYKMTDLCYIRNASMSYE